MAIVIAMLATTSCSLAQKVFPGKKNKTEQSDGDEPMTRKEKRTIKKAEKAEAKKEAEEKAQAKAKAKKQKAGDSEQSQTVVYDTGTQKGSGNGEVKITPTPTQKTQTPVPVQPTPSQPNIKVQQPVVTATANELFIGELDFANMIGYPTMGGQFYIISPVYQDSIWVEDGDNSQGYWEYDKKLSFSVYVPTEDYRLMKNKNKKVVVYARWMKMTSDGVMDLDSKTPGLIVKAGIHYTDVGVENPFKPSLKPEEPKEVLVKNDRVINVGKPCDPRRCPVGKVMDMATCNCVSR